jgi:hypothetical protein
MNEKIKAHVLKYHEKMGFKYNNDDNLIETIQEADVVWSGNDSKRRWWTDCFTVVDIEGMLIGFDDAKTTGDDSPCEKGWEFDPDSICEVEAREITTTVYYPVNNAV